jgi:hypothetical protein
MIKKKCGSAKERKKENHEFCWAPFVAEYIVVCIKASLYRK